MMWIEVKVKEQKTLINSDKILCAACSDDGLWLLCESSEKIHFNAQNMDESMVLYEGFILALNGLDFVCGESHIKPLMQSKNEALHRHILLKEALNDRK